MPLFNICASGVHNLAATLDICCHTERLENGKVKDHGYLVDKLLKPNVDKLDSEHKLLDVIFFDGAADAQAAGRLLQVHYPRLTVQHGAEHVMGLLFKDIIKIPVVHELVLVYRRIYKLFGSGAMHGPYALFQQEAKKANHGRSIGLIMAADTRMAGYIIAFHRMLRLRPALEAVASSIAFSDLKVKVANCKAQVKKYLMDPQLWKQVYLLVSYLFPALRILHLGDGDQPHQAGEISRILYKFQSN